MLTTVLKTNIFHMSQIEQSYHVERCLSHLVPKIAFIPEVKIAFTSKHILLKLSLLLDNRNVVEIPWCQLSDIDLDEGFMLYQVRDISADHSSMPYHGRYSCRSRIKFYFIPSGRHISKSCSHTKWATHLYIMPTWLIWTWLNSR